MDHGAFHHIALFGPFNFTRDTGIGPIPLVEYDGSGKATVSALAAGPDGLYFSSLYKDLDFDSAIDRGANIFRVTFVGIPEE